MISSGCRCPFCHSDFDLSNWLFTVPWLHCLRPKRMLRNFTHNLNSQGGHMEGCWEDTLLSDKPLLHSGTAGTKATQDSCITTSALAKNKSPSLNFIQQRLTPRFVLIFSHVHCLHQAFRTCTHLKWNLHDIHPFVYLLPCTYVPLLTIVYIHWLLYLFNTVFLIRMSPP